MHLKCVVLVIASTGSPYDEFRTLWEESLRTNAPILDGVEVFFLYNDPQGPTRVQGRDLYFTRDETYPYPGLLLKTLDAMQWLSNSGVTFDVLCRTNLSSLFDWTEFTRLVARIKSTYYGGRLYDAGMVSGCAMFMSSDVAAMLLANRNALKLDEPDDHAINLFLHAGSPVDIVVDTITSATPTSVQDLKEEKVRSLHYRFYSGHGRTTDVQIMTYFVRGRSPTSKWLIAISLLVLLLVLICALATI